MRAESLERIEGKLDRIIEWLEIRDYCVCLEKLGYSRGERQPDGKVRCDICRKNMRERVGESSRAPEGSTK